MKILKIYLMLNLVLIQSCNRKSDNLNFVSYNPITGVVEIYEDSIHKLKEIILLPKKSNHKQLIRITDDFFISHIENRVKTFENSNYLNTIIALDRQGNFDYFDSYYFISAPYKDSLGNEFIICSLERPLFDKGKKIAVIGKYDEFFKIINYDSDTIPFDENNEVSIPILNYPKGKNNIKFKIIEQYKTHSDTMRYRMIYVDKDFWK